MAIGFQHEVLTKEGVLRPELLDELIVGALRFAATAADVHAQLSRVGQKNLEGRLRDCLKAETGYASLFLELDLAQRLMDAGYDRFMEALLPALEVQRALCRREMLVITLDTRLSPNTMDQAGLLAAVRSILTDATQASLVGDGFVLERQNFDAVLADQPVSDAKGLYKACGAVFEPNTHVAGGLIEDGGCLVVMRSKREDDTSKPLLEAMRKAASQLSGQRPGFIAIQEHGMDAAELMLPHVRRRAGILSYALYGRYSASL
jgi:hypothetical protein